jgi:hypothetical protein
VSRKVLIAIIAKQRPGRADKAWGSSSRIHGFTAALAEILLLVVLHNPAQAVQSVTLAWDPNPDPTVVGYNLYCGVASGTYTNMVHVGNVTNITLSSLNEGTTYFFATTAYCGAGIEGDFSNEITYTVPGPPAGLQIHLATDGQIVLIVTGPIGHSYDLLATQALTAWAVIGTVTLETSGSSEFVDPYATNFPGRFYRTQERP